MSSSEINLKDPILRPLIDSGEIENTIEKADLNSDGVVSMDEYVTYQTSISPNSSKNTHASKFDLFVAKAERASVDLAILLQNCGDSFQNCPGVLKYRIPIKLYDRDPLVRKSATHHITYAPMAERAGLIRLALKSEDLDVRQSAVDQIQNVPEADCAELISLALKDKNQKVRLSAVYQIRYAVAATRASLIKQALKDAYIGVWGNAVKQIGRDVPKAERAGVIRQALNNNNLGVRKIAVYEIKRAPIAERADLFKQALNDDDQNVSFTAIQQMPHIFWQIIRRSTGCSNI